MIAGFLLFIIFCVSFYFIFHVIPTRREEIKKQKEKDKRVTWHNPFNVN